MTDEPEPVDYLSVDDLVEVASSVVKDLLIRDAGLLASAAARPRTTVFGADARPRHNPRSAPDPSAHLSPIPDDLGLGPA